MYYLYPVLNYRTIAVERFGLLVRNGKKDSVILVRNGKKQLVILVRNGKKDSVY